MNRQDTVALADQQNDLQQPPGSSDSSGTGGSGPEPPGGAPRPIPPSGGGALFKQYKPEQGKTVRVGSFVGAGALVAWGAKYVHDQLQVYEDVEGWWGLFITTGIPVLFAVVVGCLAWWVVFGKRTSGDFMIATEGEMKKVNWSTRSEVIGSTKVVILFTALMAAVLFVVDLAFQGFFRFIGVLKG